MGFDYVIREYPRQLNEMRRLGASPGPIVLIDADDEPRERRLAQLDAALKHSGVDFPSPSECIGIVVPKRNSDTWVYHIRGNCVNEEEDYKRRVEDKDALLAARTLAADCPQRLRRDCPRSLQKGCEVLNAFRQCLRL